MCIGENVVLSVTSKQMHLKVSKQNWIDLMILWPVVIAGRGEKYFCEYLLNVCIYLFLISQYFIDIWKYMEIILGYITTSTQWTDICLAFSKCQSMRCPEC
jgi:hypothetical protein